MAVCVHWGNPAGCGEYTESDGQLNVHVVLLVWFAAIAFIMDAKKGMSAMQLQRHLGIGSYETAWYLGACLSNHLYSTHAG